MLLTVSLFVRGGAESNCVPDTVCLTESPCGLFACGGRCVIPCTMSSWLRCNKFLMLWSGLRRLSRRRKRYVVDLTKSALITVRIK